MPVRATALRWLAAILVIVLVALAAHGLGERRARLGATAKAEGDLAILADSFRATLGKYHQTPTLLAASAPVLALLGGAADAEATEATNRYLEQTADRLGAAQLFIMRPDGETVSASNWREPDSFVGHNYSFRPYFREAIAAGSGTFYGVGVTTGQAGYFLSSDIRQNGLLLGVVVVKIDLVPLESLLAKRAVPVLVADGDGVVILASDPPLKYRPLRTLSQNQKIHIAAERRFARFELGAPLTARDLGLAGEAIPVMRGLPVSEGGNSWSIVTYLPTEEIRDAANFAALLGALAVMVTLLVATIFAMRGRHFRAERAAKRNLEARVEMRTLELQKAYQELASEIAERSRIDRELHRTRDDLVQAAKLAAMGQAFSGLAHEINQPLMALKTYLASLGKLIERGDSARVSGNIAVMSETVDRMSELTNSLRRLARKEDRRIERVDLATIAREVADLLKFRLADVGATLLFDNAGEGLLEGDPSRLRQVVLNLVMNAMDAVAAAPCKEIGIRVGEEETGATRQVVLAVSDTGQGVAPEVSHRLGEPFFTTKGVGDGLGLGLAISHAIVAEHGGRLTHEARPGGGTVFFLRLPAYRDLDRDLAENAADKEEGSRHAAE
jgi:two-component system, NtrC family, C4-dicarboxylate transport sensor histidine kinase DctB